jgi:nucleotide-binding universal stress UspA family protein
MAQAAGMHFSPQRIQVPVDFSASSTAALKVAQDLAQQYGSEILMVHVVPMFPLVAGLEFPATAYPHEDFLLVTVQQASDRLAAAGALLKEDGFTVRWSVEIGNDVIGNILQVIERDKADMVVLSTHGMTGWRPTVFGSIAEKVIKLAPCAVLLLRTPKTITLPSGCVEAETEVVAA